MLKKSSRKTSQKSTAHIAIVASTYNAEFVDGMLGSALCTLEKAGTGKVELMRVPGAFEIPVITARLAQRKHHRPEAIICLGVILRGKTSHADHVGRTVSFLLGQIAVETGVPVVHEVLLLENKTQAKARCMSNKTNRGNEAAHAALAMVELFQKI